MIPVKIYRAKQTAAEFIERARALEHARDYEARLLAWGDAQATVQNVPRNYVNFCEWYRDNGERPSVTLAASALRRQSMELTRALAEMRKP